MATGARHSMRIVPELTYGVTPSTPVFDIIRHNTTTLALAKDSLQSEELRSDRQIADFRLGSNNVGGDIVSELSYATFDVMLEALLGGTWTDNVLKAGIERRSFTIERFFGDIQPAQKPYHRFRGVEFNTLQLQVSANAMVQATFGTLGAGQETSNAIVAGATYNPPTTFAPMDSFTGSLTESGTEIAVVTEIQLNVDNGGATRFVVGSKNSLQPSQGRSNITGTVTAYFQDSVLLDKFINESDSSLTFTLPDNAGNSLTFEIPRLKYTGGQPDVTGESDIMLTMPFQALLDTVKGSNILITRAGYTPPPNTGYFYAFTSVGGWQVYGMSAVTPNGNSITMVSNSADATITSPPLALDGSLYDKVRFKIARMAGSTWKGDIYYMTTNHPSPNAMYKKSIPEPDFAGTDFIEIEVDFSDVADYITSTVTGFRLDFVATSGDNYAIQEFGVYQN